MCINLGMDCPQIPELLQLRTLIVKVLGTLLGCSSGLTVGPEGPMVHIGAAVAAVLTHAQYGASGADVAHAVGWSTQLF